MIDRLLKEIAEKDPFAIGVLAFFGASVAGLAALLRGGEILTWRIVVAAFLHSGMWGVIIAFLLHQHLNVPTLIAVAILSGIGGATITDIILVIIKKGLGVRVIIDNGEKEKN